MNSPGLFTVSTINSVCEKVYYYRRITPCSSLASESIGFPKQGWKAMMLLRNDVLKLREVSVPWPFLNVATRWQWHAALTLSTASDACMSVTCNDDDNEGLFLVHLSNPQRTLRHPDMTHWLKYDYMLGTVTQHSLW